VPEWAVASESLKTPSLPAVERAMAVLEEIAHSRSGMSLTELTQKLKLPRSSMHCLLVTLERCGYLQRGNSRGRYHFGAKIFSLTNLALGGIGLREIANPFLRALVRRTGLTAHMAILAHDQAVLIEQVTPAGVSRVATWLGKSLEVHCSALGKALIAYLPEEDLNRIIRDHGLPKLNDNTIVSPRKLLEELARTRRNGYSIDDEEADMGTRCLGAPVFNSEGRVVTAISLMGTTEQVTPETLDALLTDLKRTAEAVSERFGYSQPVDSCARRL
jgi:DNA-binding IclR family transcriptional regulator